MADLDFKMDTFPHNGHSDSETRRLYQRKDVYCEIDQTHTYADAPFRGHDYFATFTNAQYEALVVLLRYVTARY